MVCCVSISCLLFQSWHCLDGLCLCPLLLGHLRFFWDFESAGILAFFLVVCCHLLGGVIQSCPLFFFVFGVAFGTSFGVLPFVGVAFWLHSMDSCMTFGVFLGQRVQSCVGFCDAFIYLVLDEGGPICLSIWWFHLS
jgi:hypothetical protein